MNVKIYFKHLIYCINDKDNKNIKYQIIFIAFIYLWKQILICFHQNSRNAGLYVS